MAMIHGVLIGVVAVAVIGLLLMGTKGKDVSNALEKEVPASGPPPVEDSAAPSEKPLQLFAKQHGAFSSAESANLFMAEDPALSKAVVIKGGDTFFVWTAVGLTEEEIDSNAAEGTFKKAFTAETSACGAIGAGKLREVLTQTEMAKIKNLEKGQGDGNQDTKTKDFYKNITAITTFTDDLRIMRLHLLSEYTQANKCIKITF